jgi:hypothetical protein
VSKKIPGLDELFRRVAHSTQQAADAAVTGALASITRGGKVLWSALPYAKEPTRDGPGHVGAVEPDGVTIVIDAATGIISTGPGTGFPAGTKGDILYFDGTAWVVRHIGNQGDVLTVDTGLPVWEGLAALATKIAPLLPPVVGTTWCRYWDFTLNSYAADWYFETGPAGSYAPGVGYASVLVGDVDVLWLASTRGSMANVTKVEIIGSAIYSASAESNRAVLNNFQRDPSSVPIGHYTLGTGSIDDTVILSGTADHISIVMMSQDVPHNGGNVIRGLRVWGTGTPLFAGGSSC